MHPVLNDNSNDIDKEHDDDENYLVTHFNRVSVDRETEFDGICYSDEEEEEEFKDCNNNKSNDQNSSYFTSPNITSYDTSTTLNAHTTDVSIFN